MNSISVFLLCLFLLATTQAKTLDFSLKGTVIDHNKEWVRFKIGIEGGNQPYTYLYDEYPTGWNPVFSYLYVNKQKLTNNRRYPCKIRVKDIRGNLWQGTVVLQTKNDRLTINPQTYEYDKKFDKNYFNSDGFKGIPEMTTNQLTVRDLYERSPPQPGFSTQGQQIVKQINSLSKNAGSSTYKLTDVVDKIYQQSQNKNIFSLTNLIKAMSNSTEQDEQASSQRSDYEFDYNSRQLNQTANSFQKQFSQANTTTTNYNKTFQQPTPPINYTQPFQPTNTKPTQVQNPPAPTTNTQPQSQTQENRLTNASSTLAVPIDKIFLKLPTQKELDEIILTADSFAIIKTIQNVIRSDLNCSDKVYYLQDFMGRIQSAVELKVFAADQLQVIINAAEKQITRLKAQVASEEKRISELGIKSLQNQLNSQLEKLEAAYNKFNSIQIKIEPEMAKIAGFQKDIENLRNFNNQYRSLLSEQNLKLVEADADIEKLSIALSNAKKKRQSIATNINKLQSQILSSEEQINKDYQQIQAIEAKIDSLQEQSDIAKVEQKTLEITVDRAQKDLVTAQEKEDRSLDRISVINQKIRLQELKLATDELKRLRDMIDSLQGSIPSVSQEIDTYNFECQKLRLESQKNQDNVLIYIVGQKDYTNYIQQIYGNVPIQQSQIKSSLELSSISILSPIWKSTYGNPFTLKEMSNRNQFSFSGDFNCLEPSQLAPGSGIIREIKERTIFVEINASGNRQEIQLNLGACTRIQTTASVPKIGQSIYWTGSNTQKSNINIYRATCI